VRCRRRPPRTPGAVRRAARPAAVGGPGAAQARRRDGRHRRGPDQGARPGGQRPAPRPLPRARHRREVRVASARRGRQPGLLTVATAVRDAVLGPAVDLARAAAEEVAESPELVGEYLGATREEERVVTHRFASTARGYRGWAWAVTLARVPRGRTPTVSEVDLLPGEGALLAPTWVPWAERLRPGDLGPGDVLPLLSDDERLEPGYQATGEEDADRLAIFELGLGRERVLSREGRSEAATRWYRGSHGPTAPGAVASTAPCSTCGFLMLMAGSLRTQFGVCANEWSPDDGRVVSMDHGCGAHSQTDVPSVASEWPDPSPVVAESDV